MKTSSILLLAAAGAAAYFMTRVDTYTQAQAAAPIAAVQAAAATATQPDQMQQLADAAKAIDKSISPKSSTSSVIKYLTSPTATDKIRNSVAVLPKALAKEQAANLKALGW